MGRDCRRSLDHGIFACHWCRNNHERCTYFARDPHGEIKGETKNKPAAVFNGVGHSIRRGLDSRNRAYTEMLIRNIENDPRATPSHFRMAAAERYLRSGEYYPSAPGPTYHMFRLSTLPSVNLREPQRIHTIEGARLTAAAESMMVSPEPDLPANEPTLSDLVDSGPGSLMAKLDLKDAFRHIPVRAADWHLLGFFWGSEFYHMLVLAFGLRTAPYISIFSGKVSIGSLRGISLLVFVITLTISL